jgi:hypothetical protein
MYETPQLQRFGSFRELTLSIPGKTVLFAADLVYPGQGYDKGNPPRS